MLNEFVGFPRAFGTTVEESKHSIFLELSASEVVSVFMLRTAPLEHFRSLSGVVLF